jgi:two-component system sensor histidine kinase/response regulator
MTMLPSFLEDDTESASPSIVLVIDDDDLSLQIIAKALRETRYRVLTAANTSDAMHHARQEQPNLIITNVAMPDTDSTELIASLKETAPESCVIAMTDYGAEQLAASALKQGAEDYLIRPVHPWEVITAAAEVLERAELRRRNRQLTEALRQRQAELELRNAELEEANARLREADIWKENLSNMIIHDLKNPLGVIQGTMIYFKGTLGEDLDTKQSQLLESALISADRALKLVSAILDVHRLEEGRMPLELQPIAAGDVIQTCLDEVYPLLTMHGLDIAFDLPEDLPPVQADYNTLIRIVGNLVDNAVKFTPSGGRIIVSARRVPAGVQFSVADTGCGIPPAQHDRIFEKFAQAGIRAEGQRAGVGLGLTFCKLAVEAHNGRIWVESTQGVGATFHFVLPIWVDEA